MRLLRGRGRRRGPKTTSKALSVPFLWLNTTWDLPVLSNIASTIVLSVFWQLGSSLILVRFVDVILKAFCALRLVIPITFGLVYRSLFRFRIGGTAKHNHSQKSMF